MKNREIEQENKLKKEEEEEEGLREREEGKKGRRKENLPCWVGMASQFSPKFFAFLLLQPLFSFSQSLPLAPLLLTCLFIVPTNQPRKNKNNNKKK